MSGIFLTPLNLHLSISVTGNGWKRMPDSTKPDQYAFPRTLLQLCTRGSDTLIQLARYFMAMTESQEYYIRFWEFALGPLLGWTRSDIERWAAKWNGFSDPMSLFFHEPPSYYASKLLVPESMARRISGPEFFAIAARIETILVRTEPNLSDGGNIDWEVIRREIQEALKNQS